MDIGLPRKKHKRPVGKQDKHGTSDRRYNGANTREEEQP